jgi:signal recognition particle subunit SRP54
MQVEFTEEDVKKIIEGEINMKVIYKQLITLRKLGPLRKIL